MYQMWSGIAQYELAVATARDDQAHKQGRKPEEVSPDLTAIAFDRALVPLLVAVQLDPGLWRAQYYIGRIDRAAGADHAAAEDFTRAIAANPHEAGPYIALTELYRRWDYNESAIKVATAGTTNIAGRDSSDVWYVLGMAYDDRHDHKASIDAFTKALETRPDNTQALFQRGQAYFAAKQPKLAKADLEAFVASATASKLDFAKQTAQRMLMDLAR